MNQADWMPSSIVEREAAFKKRELIRHDLIALTAGATSLTLFAILGIWAVCAVLSGALAVLAGLSVFVGTFVIAGRIDKRRARLAAEAMVADQILKSEFGSGGWLVNLLIFQGNAPTGSDRGMIWLDDDRLYFSGHRTSFALSRDQIASPAYSMYRISGIRNVMQILLTEPTSVGPLALSIDPQAMGELGTILQGVNRWASREQSSGGQLPPTIVGPGAPSPSRLLFGAACSTAYWSLILLAAANAPSGWALFAIIVVGAFGGTALRCWSPISRWQAWNDRRRLEP